MMYNYKSSIDQIKRTQTFKTFFGLKKMEIIVQKKSIPDSNVILITCILQKCSELENLEFEIQELKKKNSNQRIKEMKDIENNGKLFSLYSNLKKKIKN